jgi:prepilin-type processing-associated H-X9-DG protein
LYVSGIVWLHSKFKLIDVKDGLSHTYMIGEKYIDADMAQNGMSWGDDQGPFVSNDRDILRWAAATEMANPPDPANYFRPHHDTRGNPFNRSDTTYGLWGNGTLNFGSAHFLGFNMSFCDGSVHLVSYEISEDVHRRCCNRADGSPVMPPE